MPTSGSCTRNVADPAAGQPLRAGSRRWRVFVRLEHLASGGLTATRPAAGVPVANLLTVSDPRPTAQTRAYPPFGAGARASRSSRTGAGRRSRPELASDLRTPSRHCLDLWQRALHGRFCASRQPLTMHSFDLIHLRLISRYRREGMHVTSTDGQCQGPAAGVRQPRPGPAALIVALTAAFAFGAIDQYVPAAIPMSSHLDAYLFAVQVSGMSAPWLLVPFLTGDDDATGALHHAQCSSSLRMASSRPGRSACGSA